MILVNFKVVSITVCVNYICSCNQIPICFGKSWTFLEVFEDSTPKEYKMRLGANLITRYLTVRLVLISIKGQLKLPRSNVINTFTSPMMFQKLSIISEKACLKPNI